MNHDPDVQGIPAAKVVKVQFSNCTGSVDLTFGSERLTTSCAETKYFLLPAENFSVSVKAVGYAGLAKSVDPHNITEFETSIVFSMIKYEARDLQMLDANNTAIQKSGFVI
jgi:hypothetical protein